MGFEKPADEVFIRPELLKMGVDRAEGHVQQVIDQKREDDGSAPIHGSGSIRRAYIFLRT